MVTAIRKVHGKNGPWATSGGYEYNLVLIAAVAALAETGPGPLSIDGELREDQHGHRRALLALALGVLGSYGASAISNLFPEPESTDTPEQSADADEPAAA
jgi:putative oxidoreductase